MTVLSVRIAESPRRVGRGAGRPNLRLPEARPKVVVLRGGRRRAMACDVAAERPRVSEWWLRLKVGAVALLSVSAATMAAVHLALPEEPMPRYVAGDPAWAHVTPAP